MSSERSYEYKLIERTSLDSIQELGNIASVSAEKADPREFPKAPYVGLEHIERDVGTISSHGTAAEVRSTKSIFRTGDLLYGKLRPYLNKVWVAQFDGLCSTDILVYPKRDGVDNSFLKYRFMVSDFVNYATENSNGVNLPRVNAKALARFPVWLPKPDEQRRIVAEIEKQFTRLEAGVAALKRAQANLKRYRAAVLKAACEGKLVPTEAELARREGRTYETGEQLLARILTERRQKWQGRGKYKEPAKPDTSMLAELPEGWARATLGQLFDVLVGATPSRQIPEYWGGDIAWVSSGEVSFCRIADTKEKITELGLQNSSTRVSPPGTVLIGMIGEGKTRGQVAILSISACNNQNSAAIQVAGTGVSSEYVYCYLMSVYEGTRRLGSGNNQPALNKSRVQAIEFPLPPILEQLRIVAEIERHLSVADEIEAALVADHQRATRLRQSILQRAFGGSLRADGDGTS